MSVFWSTKFCFKTLSLISRPTEYFICCKTALLHVRNIILTNMTNQQLTLLYLSAVFDMHGALQSDYGIQHTAYNDVHRSLRTEIKQLLLTVKQQRKKSSLRECPRARGLIPWCNPRTRPLYVWPHILCVFSTIFSLMTCTFQLRSMAMN